MLCSNGTQFRDWTADYRFYSEGRFSEDAIFDCIRTGITQSLTSDEPLVAAMDDSLLRKRGRKVHGAKYQRDPLGPPFHTNLVLSQRILQISAAIPNGNGSAEMIPVDFLHAPSPQKPRPKASEEKWKEYEAAKVKSNINLSAATRLKHLRDSIDPKRKIIAVVDNRFTTSTLLQKFPQDMTFIGRARSDSHLLTAVYERTGKPGRPKRYLAKAPTPLELLKDNSISWQEITAFAAGETRTFKVKTIDQPLHWQATGSRMKFRLIVVAPVKYRLSKARGLNYRKPAFLLCSDPSLPLSKVLQYYLWRWGIEVNFRDEKTLLGAGEAQVRSASSTQKAPALAIASYSLLLLAANNAYRSENHSLRLPMPKWRHQDRQRRPSTNDLINLLRVELWANSIDQIIFHDFCSSPEYHQKSKKLPSRLNSPMFYSSH